MQTFTVELQRRITQTHRVTVESEDFEQAKQKALEIISKDNMLAQEEKTTFVYLRTVFSPIS